MTLMEGCCAEAGHDEAGGFASAAPLEYDKIKALLVNRAASALGAAEAEALTPISHIDGIRQRLAETSEAVSVIMRKGALPVGEFGDTRPALAYAEKGGSLTPGQLLAVARQMETSRRVETFLKGAAPDTPTLTECAHALFMDKQIETRITASILSETEIADAASAELRRIRRQIAAQNENIRIQLDKIINSATYRDILRDRIVTIRDGRWVVPVKQESAKQVAGIVHDRSKGGATVFIEPQAVVNANNALRELEIEEKREIDRILAELSADVAAIATELGVNQDVLVRLDLIFAKGILSADMKATTPDIWDEDLGAAQPPLEIVNGRHPLIAAERVTPISLTLGGHYNTLVITGPNTGGKTVTLKTVGLFILMAQAGLHLPASRAVIPPVKRVFADIGDEQSIEQSLSTFSSHMKNIVRIVAEADDASIVFLDELGAGTDPTEGAALAISILETLRARGCLVMATTHYTELKKYAIAAEGVENASMEFDVETLSPTYRLRIGLPGRSNAFEISHKLGLPESIVARAREIMDSGSIAFESVIERVESDRRASEADRATAAALRLEAETARDQLDRETRAFDEKRAMLLTKAKDEALEQIADAEAYADIVKAELKALLDEADDFVDRAKTDADAPSRGDFYRRLDENRKLLRQLDGDFRQKDVSKDKKRRGAVKGRDGGASGARLESKDVSPGVMVRILSLDSDGEVLTAPDGKGEVQVLVGRIRMTVPMKDLRASRAKRGAGSGRGGAGGAGGYSKLMRAKADSVSMSIDVHGQNLDEATANVDKYIDNAMLAGYAEVTVIHGRGEGILRAGLQRMLRQHRHVKHIRTAGASEGGDGATIVTLK